MSATNHLIIGTRGSKLAQAQTTLVADALKKRDANLVIETKIITTKGDVNQSPIPLDTVGKSWFTGELEQALLAGEIDLAVHSLKDMPPEEVAGLATTIILERADPRDVLISNSGAKLADLPRGAIVGTDSVRRKALLLDQRPDLIVKSIRGNVDTRIKKLRGELEGSGDVKNEKYDAIVLAAAGLERLGMLAMVTEFFDPEIFSIAPGQGVLAAQARADKPEISAMLRAIEHIPTRIAAETELAFSRAIGGGCKLPIGCYARIESDTIFISGMMGDEKAIRKSINGAIGDAVALAEKLAHELV